MSDTTTAEATGGVAFIVGFISILSTVVVTVPSWFLPAAYAVMYTGVTTFSAGVIDSDIDDGEDLTPAAVVAVLLALAGFVAVGAAPILPTPFDVTVVGGFVLFVAGIGIIGAIEESDGGDEPPEDPTEVLK